MFWLTLVLIYMLIYSWFFHGRINPILDIFVDHIINFCSNINFSWWISKNTSTVILIRVSSTAVGTPGISGIKGFLEFWKLVIVIETCWIHLKSGLLTIKWTESILWWVTAVPSVGLLLLRLRHPSPVHLWAWRHFAEILLRFLFHNWKFNKLLLW